MAVVEDERDWNDLLTPELPDSYIKRFEKKSDGDDLLETKLEYESAKTSLAGLVRKETIESIARDAADKLNHFITGGCMPEGDGEIKCKFDLGTFTHTVHENDVTFKNSILSITGADQTKSPASGFEKVQSGLAIVSGDGVVFCEPFDKKLLCQKFEVPKGVLILQQKIGEGEFLTGENKIIELKPKEKYEVNSIKFPMGGKVYPDKQRDLVFIETE